MAARKTVTAFFSDLVDSTGLGETLDPETARHVIGRYFEESRAILERHGGRLEKFIGDAVVALFGVPTAREDDALRALRAADEIRRRIALLNEDLDRELGVRLRVRIGVNTGEVVVGDDDGDGLLVSGDTMNVAARLEQAASDGEVLIGVGTRVLGGDAIIVEELEPIALKGKAEPVGAYRLVRVLPHASPYGRRDDAPLVGRRRELATLHEALESAVADEQCVIATVVGSAGVGKSRLAREFLASLDDVHVLVGRCAAYGEGITFLPLIEALGPLLGDDPRAGVLELFAGDEGAELVADRVAAVFGTEEGGGSAEDTFWAFRRLFEVVASERPLVLMVDDIHWAELTLLDLLEYVVSFSSGAPMLLLCLTRPELLETRATWTTPRENAMIVVLAPLGTEESVALVGHLSADRELGPTELERLVAAADGNPLFLEQLLALNASAVRGEELVVPPTIQALLAARLDQLDSDDRTVLESAAIEGRVFHRDALFELLPEERRSDTGTRLLSLVRRQFIRPLRAAGSAQDAFAFVHTLVRESAYSAIPKEARGDLHARLADHLEGLGSTTVEVVGHHLAEAARYRRELGRDDEVTRKIAARAADRLAKGGRRALDRGDDRAAAKLLERAAELVAIDDSSAQAMYIELGRALAGSGMLERARTVFGDVRVAAERAGNRGLELRGELGLLSLRAQTDPTFLMAELKEAAERAAPVFQAEGDDRGLARSWFLIHWALFRMGRFGDSIEAAERVVELSQRAGDSRERLRALGAIAMASLWGPTPVAEAMRRCDELLARAEGAPLVEAFVLRVRGGLCSMTGAFDEGREYCRRSVEIFEELGHPISAVGVASELQRVERQAGALDAAERELRSAYARLTELGDAAYVSWIVGELARVVAERGQHADAIELARVCRRQMQPDHAFAHVASRIAEAIALLADGRLAVAERLAGEALELVRQTDTLDLHGDVLVVLADVDRAAGQTDSADARIAEAIALYERKGDVVSAGRVRARSASASA